MDEFHSAISVLTDKIDSNTSILLAALTTAGFLVVNRFMPLKFEIPVVVTAVCGEIAIYIIMTKDIFTRNEQ